MQRATVSSVEGETPTRRFLALATVIFVVIANGIFYLSNLDGWLMHDDEGTDFYEVWRLAEGETPGVEFIAEQQPLYLLAGSSLVGAFGREVQPLRLLAALQILAGATALGLMVWSLWGWATALLTTGLVLTNGLVYEQARLFRPDPMMLGWELAGLAAVLWAIERDRRSGWIVAGCCYGIAALWKPFALVPVAGIALFFASRLYRDWQAKRLVIADGLAFALAFFLIAGGGSLVLYNHLGFYYGEAFGYHAQMEQGASALQRVGRNLVVLLLFFWTSPLLLFTIPLYYLQRRQAWGATSSVRLLHWQAGAALLLLFVPRPTHVRYLLFLVPVLSLLLARQVMHTFARARSTVPAIRWLLIPLIVVLTLINLFTARPAPLELLLRREADTVALASLVASRTDAEDLVVSDYATINFLAGRSSIFEASIIAGGQIQSRAVTWERLRPRLEGQRVRMVLIHVEGGDPFPHQLVQLDDYDALRRFLSQEFQLLTRFNRNEQLIEVWSR